MIARRHGFVLPLALAACGAAQDRGPSDVATGAGSDAGATPAVTSDAGPDAIAPPTEPPSGRHLGATVDGDGVTFRVWAPGATAATVEGSFAAAKATMTAADDLWVAHVSGAHVGDTYHYVFTRADGPVVRLDPYCRELAGSECAIVDPAAYAWRAPKPAAPARSASVVYEMHVGAFAVPDGVDHGTFATTTAGLARLADLGVDVVELMPVQAFGGGPSSWGYNPQLFFAPKASYGSSADLRALVDEAHAHGIAAWIDVVYNHTDGYRKAPLQCFDGDCATGAPGSYFFGPGPYATTPWGPRLDYTKKQVADMVMDSVHAWLTEYRGDGFRWDSVSNIRALDGQGTTPGGRDLLVRANDWTHALGGASVAEDLKGYDAITKTTGSGGFGFDAQWDGFGYTVSDVLAGASDDARDLGRLAGAVRSNYAGDPFARLLFVEDHDTVGNGGARLPSKIDAANPSSFAARKRSMLGGVLLLTSPGVPMLFMGQEDLAAGGFVDPPAHVPPTPPTAAGAKMHAFYKDMIRLRRNLDGGAGGLLEPGIEVFHQNDAAKVLAYRRHGASGEDVIVVLNLRNKAYTRYDVGAPADGAWRVRIDTDATAYGDDFAGGNGATVAALAAAKDGKPFTLPLVLGAYSALVLTR